MNKIFTLSILILLLLSGCAKQTFYYSKTSIESNSYQQTAKENSLVIQPANQTKIDAIEADTLNNVASSNLEISSKKSITKEAQAIARHLTASNNIKINSTTTTKEGSGLKHILKKKLYKQALVDEKPANKLGKAGFILSLVGLGLTLIGLLYAPLFTIGFIVSVASIIFSAVGLSQIKSNPDKFKNKAQTTIGLVISIGTVAITILLTFLVILLLVVFLANYNTV